MISDSIACLHFFYLHHPPNMVAVMPNGKKSEKHEGSEGLVHSKDHVTVMDQ